MTPVIQPYEYMALVQLVDDLINVYQSVNDPKTIQTIQGLFKEKLATIIPEDYPEIEELYQFSLDVRLTKAQAKKYFESFKDFVVPFQEPTKKQMEKAFPKVKKLKIPDFSTMDLREHTYLGWNDPGSQKKFLLYYKNNRLFGLNGSISPNVKKNICAICQKESNVALFLTTTKSGAEGTYTKKGNYICIDSDHCNHQLTQIEHFDHFIESIK